MVSVLDKLTKDITDLEYQINNYDNLEKQNVKIRNLNIRKSFIKRIIMPIALVLTTTVIGMSLVTNNIPLVQEDVKKYQLTEYKFFSDGYKINSKYTRNPNLESYIDYYDEYYFIDNETLDRTVLVLRGVIDTKPDLYRLLNDKEYLISLFDSMYKKSVRILDYDEPRNNYPTGTLNYVDKDNYIIEKSNIVDEILYVIGDLWIVLIIYNILNKFIFHFVDNYYKDKELINEKYELEDIEDLKRHLESRKNNLKRLTR